MTRRDLAGRKCKWIIRALPPQDDVTSASGEASWHYADPTNKSLQLYLTKSASRGPIKQDVVHVSGPRKRFQYSSTEATPDDNQYAPMETDEGVDTEEVPQEERDAKRPCRVSQDSSSGCAAPVRVDSDEITLAREAGWTEEDYHGTGDCGFRCIASALEFFHHGDLVSEEVARVKGAIVRTRALAYLRKHSSEFLPYFARDSAEVDRDGVKKERDSWMLAASNPHAWIDGLLLSAIAKSYGIPMVVWWDENQTWNRTCIAPSFKNGFAQCAKNVQPMVLLLKNEHYTWLRPPPDGEIPHHWLADSSLPPRAALQGAAKSSVRSSTSTVKTPSVLTLRSACRRSPLPCTVKRKGLIKQTKDALDTHRTAEKRPRALDQNGGSNKASSSSAFPSVLCPLGSADCIVPSSIRSPSVQSKQRSGDDPPTPSVHTCQLRESQTKLASCVPGWLTKARSFINSSRKRVSIRPSWCKVAEQIVQLNCAAQHLGSPCQSDLKRFPHEGQSSVPETPPEVKGSPPLDVPTVASDNGPSSTRRRIHGKQSLFPKPPKRRRGLKETFSWTCNLCGYSFSAKCHGSFFSKKSRHIARKHSHEKDQIADRRTIYPLIEVWDLPWDARRWTCATCGLGLGLPWLPYSQLIRSRDAHLKKCASGTTGSASSGQLA